MTEQDAPSEEATADGDAPSPAPDAADEADSEASASADADLDDIAEAPDEDADTLADIATDVDPDEELVDHVAESDEETLAAELATLREEVEDLRHQLADREEAVDDLESRLARKQADFQNYKKRQQERLEEEKERATEDLVSRLLDVRDSLQRALDEEDDIRSGVESTVRQFDEQLRRENVEPIEPDTGDETDPRRHEVLMSVESDQPAGTIVDVHRPGYEMAGKVLRAAQVTVSAEEDE